MSRTIIRNGVVLLFLMTATMPVFFGCGKEETSVGPDPSDLGGPVDYFIPSVGFEARFRVYSAVGESIGTSHLKIISTFNATDYSGYVAIDSVFEDIDTFWIITSADTVFRITPGYSYANRRPIVCNHTKTDLYWPLYTVGEVGSADRYTVFFHQLPESETVVATHGAAYLYCGRTDWLAIYDQSGDTVKLGSEFFGPTVNHAWILSYTRPFVHYETYYRELME